MLHKFSNSQSSTRLEDNKQSVIQNEVVKMRDKMYTSNVLNY